jgi:hypothetical protein
MHHIVLMHNECESIAVKSIHGECKLQHYVEFLVNFDAL